MVQRRKKKIVDGRVVGAVETVGTRQLPIEQGGERDGHRG
jgi:hypothetical protein